MLRRCARCKGIAVVEQSHTLAVAAFWIGAIIDLGAAILMVWPSAAMPDKKYRETFDYRSPGFVYGMRFGAPLMFGWTVLLLWGAAAPVERRGLLLITIVPVVAGLVIVDAIASRQGILKPGLAWAIRALQLVAAVLFIAAYLSV